MAEQISSPIQVDASKTGITFEQFLKLYDGKHAELVDGEVFILSNNVIHQEILSFLDNLLRMFLGFKKLGRLLLAGVPMKLEGDVPTREPDILIILNEHLDRIKPTYLDGAADICVEIVSPESVERDYGAKLREYEAAGVREYWLLDPERHVFDIYVLQPSGLFIRSLRDEQGRVVSSLLVGFALDPALVWRQALPNGPELLRLLSEMTGIKLGDLS
jgi:Uma2 family endonuclease